MSQDGLRTRLACAACTRRKVKCSKTVPCTNCVRRREQDTCTAGSDARSVVSTPARRVDEAAVTSASPSQATPNPDTHHVDRLRLRIAELEAQLQHVSSGAHPPSPSVDVGRMAGQDRAQPGAAEDSMGHPGPRIPSRGRQPNQQEPGRDSVVEDAASILEFLAWGRRKNPNYPSIASPEAVANVGQAPGSVRDAHVQSDPPEPQGLAFDDLSHPSVLQLLLPDQARVWQLVEWHEQCVLWYHCAYYGPTLRKQLETFYSRYGGSLENPEINLQWVALLFSVLTGSMTCVPQSTAELWGYRDSERETLSKRWLQASIACLNRADYAANHSILSVQTIATLTISSHMLGFSNMQSIYLASAVRVAQSLGLHKLTPETPGTFPEKEAGRRVWTQLCIQDWFNIPFSETYLVNPLYARSEPPWNCDDEASRPLPETTPTITSFTRFRYSIATILPRLQDEIVACNTAFTKYETIIKHDKQLRSLATAGRPAFFSAIPLEPDWPAYIPWARRALAISSSHKIIMIHRSFLSESFTNPAFAFTRRTCLAASKTIIKEFKCVVEEDGPSIWVHQAFSVAASIILILDVFHQDPDDRETAEHKQMVEDVVGILKTCRNSMVALRGAKLLSSLLEETDNVAASQGRKRRADEIGDGRTGKRQRGFNVGAFVKSFCEGQAPPARDVPGEHQSPTTALMQSMPMDPFPDFSSFDAAASVENLLNLANSDFYSF